MAFVQLASALAPGRQCLTYVAILMTHAKLHDCDTDRSNHDPDVLMCQTRYVIWLYCESVPCLADD